MAEESPLETTAKKEFEKAPAEAKAAAKAPSGNYLDLIVNQFKLTGKVTKTAVKVAGTALIVGAAMGISYLLFGLDAPIVSAGLIGGDWLAKWKNKEKITYKDTIVKGVAGSILGGFLHYAFPAMHLVGDYAANAVASTCAPQSYSTAAGIATKSGVLLGTVIPGWVYLENNILYPMLDSNVKPLNKKEFMDSLKRAIKAIGLVACLNVNFTPESLQIPSAAAITTLYGYASAKPGEKPKELEQKAPAPGGYYTPQPGFA